MQHTTITFQPLCCQKSSL